jgi:hypothetical protein
MVKDTLHAWLSELSSCSNVCQIRTYQFSLSGTFTFLSSLVGLPILSSPAYRSDVGGKYPFLAFPAYHLLDETIISFANWKISVVPYIAQNMIISFQPHLIFAGFMSSASHLFTCLPPTGQDFANWFPRGHGRAFSIEEAFCQTCF